MGKIVIVSANHAGTAAANAILDSHPRDEVTILDENTNISFLGGDMALWIGKQILKPDGLFYQTANDFRAKGATIHLETHVESIDYDDKVSTPLRATGTFSASPTTSSSSQPDPSRCSPSSRVATSRISRK